ncbi:hypothetical protein NVIE_019040 [Nitrososphaera viennensis EN76]|uniref:Uncharacterized protein n=1 Tax=Nitrososphaera viennensis EN76 TaxID=926571 RepID=A0A060HHT9_9ARCH|nr:hypothetical protein NVIE_019040 [Nitrososphaera viennensis EN76]
MGKNMKTITAKAETFAYFNNHYNAKAPTNALELLQMMGAMTES